MEVTKYYCEVCRSEVGQEQFARVECKISFRNMYGNCRDSIHVSKRICDKCVEDLGFPATPEDKEIRKLGYKLSNKEKFMGVVKKILGWKGK